ncbi:ribosome-associated heat shock protein Hsp15 [Pleionea sediminis]|uniref:ribosome-associated heat shock protein Hsp15 n=1 Tax=Pleionea sediminis TaxID=2569479 RepID=UPI0011848244|nr:ribosome-associated heat shock protein Hsp15 [Pleionea sediminis]
MEEKVRLDKWLWAARFFKTRALAKAAIEGGKVHYDGQRVKPGRSAQIDGRVTLRIGFDEKEIIIKSISDRRGPAPEAQKLYEETEESIKSREEARALRKAAGITAPQKKPDKKQRRQIHRFKRINTEE